MRKAIALLILPLLLTSCPDEGNNPEADKMEKEVARRVEVAKNELKTEERSKRLKTIRIVGFVFLSAGSAACLVWLSRPRPFDPYARAGPSRSIPPPQWRDFRPPRKGRVLDLSSTAPGRRSHETTSRR